MRSANVKVGAVPLTRAALRNPKVRHELAEGEAAAGGLQAIDEAHQKNTAVCRALGLNAAVLEQQLPRRFDVVAPPTEEEDIIRKLVEGRASQSAMWVTVGAVAFNSAAVNKAGCAILQAELDTKADRATSKLATFAEAKDAASSILSRMRDLQLTTYDDLASGEPKALVRFYFIAKGETGISKYGTVALQVEFLNSLGEAELEELLLLDAPPGCAEISQVETAAQQMLKTISDSTRRTIDYGTAPAAEVAEALALGTATVEGVEVLDTAQLTVIDAAAAGFDAALLPGDTLLDTRPPLEKILAFQSADGEVLKGREILYKFAQGWYRGRVLKQATDRAVKTNKRICNYRVFFEADDEMINQPLYTQTYAKNAAAGEHSWVLLALPGEGGRAQLLLEAPTPPPAALKGPRAPVLARMPPQA